MIAPENSLPHSEVTEEYLISSLLVPDADFLSVCIEAGASPQTFYLEAHATIYARCLAMREQGFPIEQVSLIQQLRANGELEQVGGIHAVLEIAGRVGTTAESRKFLNELLALQHRRKAVRLAAQLRDAALSGSQEAFEDASARVKAFAAQEVVTAAPLFVLWAPSQFLAHVPNPSGKLLAGGIVEKGEWTSFLGVGGIGKSRMALAFIIAQMTNREWCGLPTGGDPQRTIFFSTENGVERWRVDLERMLAGLSERERAVVEENLRGLALTAEEDGDLNVGSPETCARLTATLKKFRPGLIVLDPFADMIEGDENKATDVVATLRKLRRILHVGAPGAAVLIIHHARTGSSNVAQAGDNYSAGNFGRGSKALYSRVRAEIQLAPADRDDRNRLVLACGKNNNGPGFSTRGIVFDPETFEYTVDPDFDVNAWRNDVAGKRTEAVVAIVDVVEAVRRHYRPGEDVTNSQIIEPLKDQSGASAKTIQRRLNDAARAGYLRAGSKRGTWKLGHKPLPK